MKSLLDVFGSQKTIADTLGVSESAVSQWFKAGELPIKRAMQIVRMTKGQVKLKDITRAKDV